MPRIEDQVMSREPRVVQIAWYRLYNAEFQLKWPMVKAKSPRSTTSIWAGCDSTRRLSDVILSCGGNNSDVLAVFSMWKA